MLINYYTTKTKTEQQTDCYYKKTKLNSKHSVTRRKKMNSKHSVTTKETRNSKHSASLNNR